MNDEAREIARLIHAWPYDSSGCVLMDHLSGKFYVNNDPIQKYARLEDAVWAWVRYAEANEAEIRGCFWDDTTQEETK